MYKGTTPTFTFTFTNFDPTTADKIIVSFGNGLDITDENLNVTSNSIACWLSQEQSLRMPNGNVKVQINFLFSDGQRTASVPKVIEWNPNLYNEVME